MSVYRGYFVLSETDAIGFLTMTIREAKKGNCGGFIHEINWKTGRDELKGFIIQKVCFTNNKKLCPGADAEDCKPMDDLPPPINEKLCIDICYLEMWTVDGTYIGNGPKDDQDRIVEDVLNGGRNNKDTFSLDDCDKTFGDYTMEGQAIFLPMDWILANPGFNPKDLLTQGGEGVIHAHSLFSRCWTDPGVSDFWARVIVDNPVQTTLKSLVKWDCCVDKSSVYDSEFVGETPKPDKKTDGK